MRELSGITKEEFEAYVTVQMSGVTNMFDVRMVQLLSGLTEDKIFTIMKNYGSLKEQFKLQTLTPSLK